MTLSSFLQGMISIVFIYLILALFTSELQETLATLSEARAKRLKQSIRQMLGEEEVRLFNDGWRYYSSTSCRNNAEVSATWQRHYSLQDEELVRANKGLQKYNGSPIASSFKVWRQRNDADQVELLRQVQNEANIVSDAKIDPTNEFVWIVGDHECPAVMVIANDRKPDQGFVGAEKKVIAKRYPVYQVDLPLLDGTRYYVDERNHLIRSPLPVASLTEKIYQDPRITALNQTACEWRYFFGLYLPISPLKLKNWTKDHVVTLCSTVSLIVFVIALLSGREHLFR